MHICKSDQRGPDCENIHRSQPRGRFVHRGTCQRHKLRYTSSPKYTQSLLSKKSRRTSGASAACDYWAQTSSRGQAKPGPHSFVALRIPSSTSPAPVQVTRLPGLLLPSQTPGRGGRLGQALLPAMGDTATGRQTPERG